MQRPDPRDAALALDVLQQGSVQVLAFAAGHGFDVADHHQQLLGPRDGDVQPLRLLQEANPLGLVAPHQAEDDHVRLFALEGIDGVDRQSGERDHPQLAAQLRDLVLVHGDHRDPQLLEVKPLEVADDTAHRLDLRAVRDAARSTFLLPAADRQPGQVAVEGPWQRRTERRHLRRIAQPAIVRGDRHVTPDGGRHPVLLVEHHQVGLRHDDPAQLEEAGVPDHRLRLVLIDGEGRGTFVENRRQLAVVAHEQPARGQPQQRQRLGEADLVGLVEDEPVEHLGFLTGKRDPVHGSKDDMRVAHPWIVGLHDAGPELRVDLLGLGDAHHSERVETLQPLLRIVHGGVRVRRHQDAHVWIPRHQLTHGLHDRCRFPGSWWALHQLHAAGEEVDRAAHGLLLAGIEALVEGLQRSSPGGQHLVGCDQQGRDAAQADVAGGEAVQGTLLHLDDGRDRLRPDRARPQRAVLPQLHQPATAAAFPAEQGPFPVRAMGGADDDAIAFLEPAAATEHDQRPGAPVAVGRPADAAFDAIDLQVLALAADHPFGLDLVRTGILLCLPGEPLPFVVGKCLAGQHQGQLGGLLERGQLPADPVFLGHVGDALQRRLGDLDGEHVAGVLRRVGVRLDALHHEGDVTTGQAEELPDQTEALDARIRPLLEVQRVAHGCVLDVHVPVTLGGFGQEGHQGVLAEVVEQRLSLALRRAADVQPDRGDVGGAVGKRRPRDNRRQP